MTYQVIINELNNVIKQMKRCESLPRTSWRTLHPTEHCMQLSATHINTTGCSQKY